MSEPTEFVSIKHRYTSFMPAVTTQKDVLAVCRLIVEEGMRGIAGRSFPDLTIPQRAMVVLLTMIQEAENKIKTPENGQETQP